MNTTERELLEQCMDEIKDNSCNIGGQYSQKTMRLLAKIEAYLAKPVQEPIGTVRQTNGCTYVEWNHIPPEAGTVCYSAPQLLDQPPLVQIASDIMGACMNGDLSDKWEDVADLLVSNNFDGLSKLTQSQKQMSDDEILEAIARGWCHDKNSHKEMDSDLALAIAEEVALLYSPLLNEAITALRYHTEQTRPIHSTDVAIANLEAAVAGQAKPGQEPSCNLHPNAPHGFSRNASHSANRYVCECEGWSEKENVQQEPMSDKAIDDIWGDLADSHGNILERDITRFARAIEAHHGIK
jgi:hypothetical protein